MGGKKPAARRDGPPPARLIAVDGTRAADLRKRAEDLRRQLAVRGVEAGISWWDASGMFFEMGLGKRKHRAASARTLLLLYASDLLFRLRWEIRPALAAGQTVIAAPYLDTAVAFGRANGLTDDWLASVFRFALKPDERHLAHERKKSSGWGKERGEGFAEFSSAVLADTAASFDPVVVRREMMAFLEAAATRRE